MQSVAYCTLYVEVLDEGISVRQPKNLVSLCVCMCLLHLSFVFKKFPNFVPILGFILDPIVSNLAI